MHGPTDVLVQPGNYGLGYPTGNRSLSELILITFAGNHYLLDILTSGYHVFWHYMMQHSPLGEPRGLVSKTNCNLCMTPCDLFLEPSQRALSLLRFSSVAQLPIKRRRWVLVDAPELDFKKVEGVVTNFLKREITPSISPRILWPAEQEMEESKWWDKERSRRINWLRGGAKPLALSIAPGAFDSLNPHLKEGLIEGLKQRGFKEGPEGALNRDADKVEDRDFVEARMLQIADLEQGDHGAVYLSPGSWPSQNIVVANGIRHYIDWKESTSQKRYWVGYFQSKKLLVMLDADTGIYTTLELPGDPDFLEAMDLVYTPSVAS